MQSDEMQLIQREIQFDSDLSTMSHSKCSEEEAEAKNLIPHLQARIQELQEFQKITSQNNQTLLLQLDLKDEMLKAQKKKNRQLREEIQQKQAFEIRLLQLSKQYKDNSQRCISLVAQRSMSLQKEKGKKSWLEESQSPQTKLHKNHEEVLRRIEEVMNQNKKLKAQNQDLNKKKFGEIKKIEEKPQFEKDKIMNKMLNNSKRS